MLLAFDTATPAVTVALHDGERVVASQTRVDARRHGELLAPAITAVLDEAWVPRQDVTAIAVGVGPGPFTGLRVGLVTARTLGLALDVPVYGVCTLDVLAAEAVDAGRHGRVPRRDGRPSQGGLLGVVRRTGRACRRTARGATGRRGDATTRRGRGRAASTRSRSRRPRGRCTRTPRVLADVVERRAGRAARPGAAVPASARRHGPRPAQAGLVILRPATVDDVEAVAALEAVVFGSDAWSSELGARGADRRASHRGGGVRPGRRRLRGDGDGRRHHRPAAHRRRSRRADGEGLGARAARRRAAGGEPGAARGQRRNEGALAFYAAEGFARSTGGRLTTGTAPTPSSWSAGEDEPMTDEPLVLGIETSCDETGVGIVRGRTLLADAVASSVDEHARFGGVVPEVASRAHLEAMVPTIERACETAGVALHDVDAIAVTNGPGLAGALLVGVAAAKALAIGLGEADLRREPPRGPRRRRPARARAAARAVRRDARQRRALVAAAGQRRHRS